MIEVEKEHKFLVVNTDFVKEADKILQIKQGYISHSEYDPEVRISIRKPYAWIMIKDRKADLTRDEFRVQIPPEEAEALLKKYCKDAIIEKTRFIIPIDSTLNWEVDLFHNPKGQMLAEVESESLDFLKDNRPSWLGDEVTGDPDYYNCNLV